METTLGCPDMEREGREVSCVCELAPRIFPFLVLILVFCFGEGLEKGLQEAKEATSLA